MFDIGRVFRQASQRASSPANAVWVIPRDCKLDYPRSASLHSFYKVQAKESDTQSMQYNMDGVSRAKGSVSEASEAESSGRDLQAS